MLLYIALGMKGSIPLLLTALWVTSTFPGNIFCGKVTLYPVEEGYELIFTVPAAFFVEKIGRRKFLLTGLTGILVCLICETALQASFLGTNNKAGQDAAIFFIFLFITPFWSTFMDASQFLYVYVLPSQ